ncbi:hypothetical protein Tco_0231908 [Tanacetum coccineum]
MNDVHNKWDDMIESKNELLQSLGEMLRQQEHADNLSTYTTEPSRRFNSFYDDDDYEESTIPLNEIVSQIPSSIAITPESDEFIKSSVEDLVLIPSESEDTFESDEVCDLSSCDDFSPINIPEEESVTLSNPLFDSNDDFTSSDDESLSDEDVPEDNVKVYSNPLFEIDDEYISSDVNPLFDVVLEDIKNIDVKDGYHDSKGDIIYFENLLIYDTFPNLPPKVFLDRDPRSLEDELDKDDLKNIVKDCLDFEDSHARGFVLCLLDRLSLA